MDMLAMVGMTLAAIVALGYPLVANGRRNGRTQEAADDLRSRKASVYRDIKDLEFDREMGKVSDADYGAMREDYETEAVQVLEALDRSGNGRHRGEAAACPGCGESPGAGARFCPGCGRELGAACAACGAAVGEGDRFCGSCGRPVPHAV